MPSEVSSLKRDSLGLEGQVQVELEVWRAMRVLDYAKKKYLALPGSAFLEVTDRKLRLRVAATLTRSHQCWCGNG